MTKIMHVGIDDIQPSEANWFSEKGLEHVLFCLLHNKPMLPVLTRKQDRYVQVDGRHRLLGHSILGIPYVDIIAPSNPNEPYKNFSNASSEAIAEANEQAQERWGWCLKGAEHLQKEMVTTPSELRNALPNLKSPTYVKDLVSRARNRTEMAYPFPTQHHL